MHAEIAGLPALTGFIKIENHFVPAKFRLAKKQSEQPEFMERAKEQLLQRKVNVVITSDPKQWFRSLEKDLRRRLGEHVLSIMAVALNIWLSPCIPMTTELQ